MCNTTAGKNDSRQLKTTAGIYESRQLSKNTYRRFGAPVSISTFFLSRTRTFNCTRARNFLIKVKVKENQQAEQVNQQDQQVEQENHQNQQ